MNEDQHEHKKAVFRYKYWKFLAVSLILSSFLTIKIVYYLLMICRE